MEHQQRKIHTQTIVSILIIICINIGIYIYIITNNHTLLYSYSEISRLVENQDIVLVRMSSLEKFRIHQSHSLLSKSLTPIVCRVIYEYYININEDWKISRTDSAIYIQTSQLHVRISEIMIDQRDIVLSLPMYQNLIETVIDRGREYLPRIHIYAENSFKDFLHKFDLIIYSRHTFPRIYVSIDSK